MSPMIESDTECEKTESKNFIQSNRKKLRKEEEMSERVAAKPRRLRGTDSVKTRRAQKVASAIDTQVRAEPDLKTLDNDLLFSFF